MNKLVFADVDGTMLKHGAEQASPDVVAAIGRMMKRGDVLIPVTSRTPLMMGRFAMQVGLRHTGILDGGATVFDFGKNTIDTMHSRWLAPGTTRQVVESMRPYADEIYYGEDSQRDDGRHYSPEASPSVFAVYPSAFETPLLKALSHVTNIAVHTNTYEDTTTHRCGQVVVQGVSKQSGVRALLVDPQYSGFAPENIVAIGDGDPDEDLLRAVPRGAQRVNVGDNAKLRAIATATVRSAETDGFAEAVERFVLR